MYAVIVETIVSYLGDSESQALNALKRSPNACMIHVEDLEDLKRHIEVEPEEDEDLAEAATRIFDRLDDLGFNLENVEDFGDNLRAQSQQAITELRGLGIKGMKALGEGFVALGDLLRQAVDEEK